MTTDYMKYRGKCKELSEELCKKDNTLVLVRGHYFCPIWNTENQHWWCEKPDGTIVDPTRKQFPSHGHGIYTPFNGYVQCSNCGHEMKEEEGRYESNYVFCSILCHMRFVGL